MTQTSLEAKSEPSLEAKQGILLINKPKGHSSFSLIRTLRRRLNIRKIGHAGTLDPFATGVMIYLIGRDFTRKSDLFLNQDKEYIADVHLGVSTDTFDTEGKVTAYSEKVPTYDEVMNAITHFQGDIEQIPPMYSAKKVNGKKLCDLAREGKTAPRKPIYVKVETEILAYDYPNLRIQVNCSKGTYIRSIADELGAILGCGAHLSDLTRIRSGQFCLDDCLDGDLLQDPDCPLANFIRVP
ncbi:tRNA pseudouridine synthase B [Chlamydiales bacterium SCGC AG-110-M15]|nr:tRNA pseudouridine synthase B [Chlamydiales bacterium SCGC AG-110-M15]